MEKKQISSEKTNSLIVALILLVIGILLCCSFSFGTMGLSALIGVGVFIAGVLLVVNSIKANISISNAQGFFGMILISFAVMFIVNDMASIIVGFIPWCMISIGVTLFIDSFLLKFAKKNISLAKFIIILSFGVATITVGICLKTIRQFAEYATVMLGVVFILYAILMIVNTLRKKK